jgi:hypothetical protein
MTDIAVQDASALATTVRRAADGDEAAFAWLVAEHRVAMTRVAFVICGDPESTQDAVHPPTMVRCGTSTPWPVTAATFGSSSRRLACPAGA